MAFTKIAAAGIGSTGTVILENIVVTGDLNASSITGAASTANVRTDSLAVSGVTTSSGGFVGNVTGNATGLSGTPDLTVGIVTATSFRGTNASITGLSTFAGGIQVGATTSITVGNTVVRGTSIGIGTTTTTGRNTGIGTATGTIIYNSTTNSFEGYGPTGWINIASNFSATGGNLANGLDPGNGYRYHTFGSTGTFTVSSGNKTAEILMVASGAGGGSRNGPVLISGTDGGGGGGAGGLVASTVSLSPGTYTITIAGGGAGGPIQSPGSAAGDTTLVGSVTLTAKGGGFGGCGPLTPNPGGPGGSGGGEGSGGGTLSPDGRGLSIQPTQTQSVFATFQSGNPGGRCANVNPPHNGSGGGGAGGAGGNGNSGGPGIGGAGLQFPNFSGPLIGIPALNPLNGFFAGGGGGGAHAPSNNPGPASAGGGPGGATNTNGTNATTNTGGGGGGGGGSSVVTPGGGGGSGGSGIVVIRYLI